MIVQQKQNIVESRSILNLSMPPCTVVQPLAAVMLSWSVIWSVRQILISIWSGYRPDPGASSRVIEVRKDAVNTWSRKDRLSTTFTTLRATLHVAVSSY